MANQNVETVTAAADKAKLGLSLLALAAGIVGFYLLAEQPLVLRVLSVLAGVAAAAVIGWFSAPGQQFFGFARDSWYEMRRVVWPDKKATTQMTLRVFGFVVLMAIFLWLVDKGLQWVLYDLILGWK